MDIMPNKMVKKGQVIFSEGDAPDGVYYITEGRVVVSRMVDGTSKKIAELEAGDIFGELAMIDESPRSATITAAEDTWLYTLNRKVFEQKLKALDHLMYTVFLRMTLSIRNMNIQIDNLNRLVSHTMHQTALDQTMSTPLQAPPPAHHPAQVDTSFIPPAPAATTPTDNLSMIEDYINQPRFRF